MNITNPTWSPEIIYGDISKSGKKELVIILTKETGTGVLKREVYVVHLQEQKYDQMQIEVPVEVLVDNPIEILLQSIKSELSPNKTSVSVGNKKYIIDLKALGIQPGHLLDEIYLGNLINFE